MSHSEKRRGKVVKTDRTIKGSRKAIYALETLFDKAYNAKAAEGLAEGTLYRYRHAHALFLQYLDSAGVRKDIRYIDVDTCREFVTYLLEDRVRFDGHKYKPDSAKTEGVSPRYTNDIIKTLRTTFRVLKTDGLVSENLFESVKAVKHPEKLINVLTPEELKALLDAPDQRQYSSFRDYVALLVMIDTMARVSEVLTLTVNDVDLNAREIVFKSEITKTRRGRIVPIQPRTARLIKELMVEIAEFESDYIFLANYGEPLQPNHFRKQLLKYAEKAGIKKHVHPHLIRHSTATMYLEGGGNLRYLQALLGHIDQRMTARYTHISRQSIADNHEQYSALNQVIGKLNKPRKVKR
ncbi:tyrosine-type recombinase/integrase [Cytobacillus oceanisediminis]|uniref:Integrase n=1 Tax=Cytobacillus oceanisediminis TaxID=665099 RepID=A0ABX3CLI0_9BACI|nr:tyrosine-type recombinase/integrase [Cytobacillus oceanisediminis]OHX42364.1 integrase [Cytobacillus oceanisediminis]